jgi:hypothetical protein
MNNNTAKSTINPTSNLSEHENMGKRHEFLQDKLE